VNGIANVLDGRDGARLQCVAVHQDRIELHVTIEIEMRTDAGVENRIVFEQHDGGFGGIYRGAAVCKEFPAGRQRAADAGAAGVEIFRGNISGAAMDDERGFQSPVQASGEE